MTPDEFLNTAVDVINDAREQAGDKIHDSEQTHITAMVVVHNLLGMLPMSDAVTVAEMTKFTRMMSNLPEGLWPKPDALRDGDAKGDDPCPPSGRLAVMTCQCG